MRFLILTCDTEQCCDLVAPALKEEFFLLGHECVIKDVLSYSSSASYQNLNSIINSKKLYSDIVDDKINAVLCTHVYAAQALTRAKQKYGLDIPTCFISTNYSCYPFWEKLNVDIFFVAHKLVADEYVTRGMDKDKIIVSGIPIFHDYIETVPKIIAKAELGFDINRFLCIIILNDESKDNVIEIINRILNCHISDFDILVLARNNHNVCDSVNENFCDFKNIAALSAIDKLDLYIKASDLIITKPDSLLTSAAVSCNVPLILTRPTSGCENDAYNILTHIGCALNGNTIDNIVFSVKAVYYNEDARNDIIYSQMMNADKNSAKTICKYIIKTVK